MNDGWIESMIFFLKKKRRFQIIYSIQNKENFLIL